MSPKDDKIHLDFETRSPAPFGKQQNAVTVYQYARHPETDVLLASYAINDGPVLRWRRGHDIPDDLAYAVKHGLIVAGHNAAFEWAIWNNVLRRQYSAPELHFSQLDCTAVRASVMALPRSLAGACEAMGLDIQKDAEGAKVMLKMAKPRRHRKDEDPTCTWWWDTPELMDRLHDYCDVDVLAERALDNVLEPLSRDEWELWQMDHRTNQRGVKLDMPFIQKAKKVMAVVDRRYGEELETLTDGKVRAPTEVAEIQRFVELEEGIKLSGLDKNVVANLLTKNELSDVSMRVLAIRQEAGKSSVAKLRKFEILSHHDDIMRENFLHHGANTGRGAGKGAQLQNLPSRGGLKWQTALQVMDIVLSHNDPEWTADCLEILFGHIPEAFSSCLRSCITARENRKMFVADYSNIEGRIAAWLGREVWKLEAFRLYDTPLLDDNGQLIPDPDTDFKRKGPDLYKVTAASIMGVTPDQVSKSNRNVLGKVPELSLGFQGGAGALLGMAETYNIHIANYWDSIQAAVERKFVDKARENWDSFGKKSGSDKTAWVAGETIKLAWRARHPGIVRSWKECEDQAINAILDAEARYARHEKALKTNPNAKGEPGKWFKVMDGKCAFGAKKIGSKLFLIGRLPSGRRVYKADVSLKVVEKFGRPAYEIRYWTVDAITKKWVRATTYGGDLFQTFVQAIARDIMKFGMQNVETAGFEPILEVHDEVGAEGEEDRELDEFCRLMELLPLWAGKELPISALGYVADRYRKD